MTPHAISEWIARRKRALYHGDRPHGVMRLLTRIDTPAYGARWGAPRHGAVLTVRGRTTAEQVSIPIVVTPFRDSEYLVSMLGPRVDWVRNVHAAGGRAMLRRRGREESVTLYEVGTADRAEILRRYVAVAPGARPHLGLGPHDELTAFARVAAHHPVFRVARSPGAIAAADDSGAARPLATAAGSLERRYAPHFVGVVVLHVLGAVAGLVPLLAVAELGRLLLSPHPDPTDVWLAVAAGAAGVALTLLFGAASGMLGHLLDGRVQLSMRRRLVQHLGQVPLGWLASRRTGEMSRIVGDDVSALHPLIAHVPAEIASAIVVPTLSLVYLLAIDWRLTLVALIPVAVALTMVPFFLLPTRAREQEQYEAALGTLSSVVVELVQGIAEAKVFGLGGRARQTFLSAAYRFVDVFSKWVRGMSPPAAGMQVALSTPFVLLTVSTGAAVLISAGELDAPDALPFLLLGVALTAPVAALGHGFDDMTAGRRALKRINAVLRTPALEEPSVPRTPVGHRIEFRGVHFTYPGGEEILRGVDLSLEPGTLTALVGPSGAGKSTLARLLIRFFDATAGSVSIGGVDVRDIARRELYEHVAFVFQDVQLLQASVFDNIALPKPGATSDEVERAARLAGIHERILQLPRGYDTVVGIEGVLSGGEAQRVTLARALVTDAPILVLDEPTSFADPATERLVRHNLRELRRSRTILLIAHRREAVSDADFVAALEGGVIVQHGRPGELLSESGGTFTSRAHASAPRASKREVHG